MPLQAIVEKAPTLPQPVHRPRRQWPEVFRLRRGDKPKDIKGVYILQGNKVKFVEVTTGITGESDIEILSGVPPETEIITGPSRVLKTLERESDGQATDQEARRRELEFRRG